MQLIVSSTVIMEKILKKGIKNIGIHIVIHTFICTQKSSESINSELLILYKTYSITAL